MNNRQVPTCTGRCKGTVSYKESCYSVFELKLSSWLFQDVFVITHLKLLVYLHAVEYFFCLVKTQNLLVPKIQHSESAVLLSSAGAAEDDSPFLRAFLSLIPLFVPLLGCNMSPMSAYQLLAPACCVLSGI